MWQQSVVSASCSTVRYAVKYKFNNISIEKESSLNFYIYDNYTNLLMIINYEIFNHIIIMA